MSMVRWEGLDPATIELAIKALIMELNPGARPIDGRGGDGGRDVRWDSAAGLVVFEIKSYAGDRLKPGQRSEIKKSLIQAVQHAPVRWVLVLPLDHSPSEEAWFDGLARQHPKIKLEWWGRTWLNLEFGKREYLRRLVEGESYELLQRAHEFDLEQQVLGGVTDAIGRFDRLATRMRALSTFWRPDVFTTPNGIGVVYNERFPGAAALDPVRLRPTFVFPTDDDEAAVVQRRLSDVLDYGGDIEVDGRYVASFEVLASPASRALFDVSGPTEKLRITSVSRHVGPPPVYQLVAVAPSGRVRFRLPLQMDAPSIGERGARAKGADASGTFTVVHTADRPEYGGAVATNITIAGMAGRYPFAVRPAFEIFAHMEPGDRLEIRVNDHSAGSAVDDLCGFLPEARLCTEVVTALEKLQSHTGVLFPIPDDLTRQDAHDLIFAARLVDGEQVRGGRSWLGLTIRADKLADFLDMDQVHTEGGLVVEMAEYTVTCGAHRLNLGPVAVVAPRMCLANLDELRAAVGTGDEPVARYECIDGEGVYFRVTSNDNLDSAAGARPVSGSVRNSTECDPAAAEHGRAEEEPARPELVGR